VLSAQEGCEEGGIPEERARDAYGRGVEPHGVTVLRAFAQAMHKGKNPNKCTIKG